MKKMDFLIWNDIIFQGNVWAQGNVLLSKSKNIFMKSNVQVKGFSSKISSHQMLKYSKKLKLQGGKKNLSGLSCFS